MKLHNKPQLILPKSDATDLAAGLRMLVGHNAPELSEDEIEAYEELATALESMASRGGVVLFTPDARGEEE